jgi:hypothetical protein
MISTDDDTVTVNTLSKALSDDKLSDEYLDETPTQDSVNEPRVKDYISRRRITSPVSLPEPASESSSSMWDELENIKRRIRQLELAHPGATTAAERPHTRGTTNSSSSPQRSSPFPSQAGTSITSASSPTSYPLLNAAITKVKASGLSIEIARAIEATAQEAISLAMTTTSDPQPPSPRAIRRKVDGVCRGLTEVCLALADHQQFSVRQQTRAAQHMAEDAQDTSPLSATGRQSMTLSRSTARRLSVGTNVSRTGSLNSTSRTRRTAPAHSVVGLGNEEFDDDGVTTVSRPGISRYSTIQYRPPSRAATEIYRDTTPPAGNLQRFATSRRSLLSRHGPSMSDYQLPSSTQESLPESPPLPRSATTSTFPKEDRRRSLNLQTYFSSPPQPQRTYVRDSPSMISPPRVNVANSTVSSAGERRDATIRRRPAGSVAGERYDDDGLVRAANPNRRSMGSADVRRHNSLTQNRFVRDEM